MTEIEILTKRIEQLEKKVKEMERQIHSHNHRPNFPLLIRGPVVREWEVPSLEV